MENRHTKKVLVFGVFDGLDEGHRFFLSEAKKFGDELIVVVARDESVRRLKKKDPMFSVVERIETIRKSGLVDVVVIGDEKEGEWLVLKKMKPEIVALGHDQIALKSALEAQRHLFKFKFEIVHIGRLVESSG